MNCSQNKPFSCDRAGSRHSRPNGEAAWELRISGAERLIRKHQMLIMITLWPTMSTLARLAAEHDDQRVSCAGQAYRERRRPRLLGFRASCRKSMTGVMLSLQRAGGRLSDARFWYRRAEAIRGSRTSRLPRRDSVRRAQRVPDWRGALSIVQSTPRIESDIGRIPKAGGD